MLLRANNNSVRTKLGYLAKKNNVWRVTKGVYQSTAAIIREEIDPLIRFHGIKFEFRCIKRGGWPYLDLEKVVTEQLKTPWIRKHPTNHSIITSTDWEGRTVNISLHPPKTNLLEVFNKSSLLPLHPIEFGTYCGFIVGVFKIPPEFWILKQIGVNIDFKRVQLDTWKHISMKVAQGRVLRMYQKSKDLRLETHTSSNMTAREAMVYLEKVLIVAEELQR